MLHCTRASVAVGLLALGVAACADSTGTSTALNVNGLSAAFSAVPAAFSNVESSFQGGTPDGVIGPFADEMHGRHGGPPGMGGGPGIEGMRGRGPEFGGLMGGGMFHGIDEFPGGGRPGAHDLSNCTFANGRVTCPDDTHNGLTFTRSFAFTTASGTAQAQPDSTTNTVNAKTSVSGTTTRHNGGTSVVNHSSDRTVTGLAAGSTQRTINATSQGTETTQFTDDSGTAVNIDHSASDIVSNVVVPVSTGAPSYPTSGSVQRAMTVSITRGSAATETLMRSETITYNGTDTATLVITTNGVAKTCTLPLPHGRPVCP
jgi:hypothetical protein